MTTPKPPVGLLKTSRDRWSRFWDSPAAQAVNLDSDLPRLIRWIQASDEYERSAKTVRTARLVKGSMGQPVLNPLVNYLTHLDGIITRTETEFGMTPASRKRLEIGNRAAPGNPLDELRARRERKLDTG